MAAPPDVVFAPVAVVARRLQPLGRPGLLDEQAMKLPELFVDADAWLAQRWS